MSLIGWQGEALNEIQKREEKRVIELSRCTFKVWEKKSGGEKREEQENEERETYMGKRRKRKKYDRKSETNKGKQSLKHREGDKSNIWKKEYYIDIININLKYFNIISPVFCFNNDVIKCVLRRIKSEWF